MSIKHKVIAALIAVVLVFSGVVAIIAVINSGNEGSTTSVNF